MGGEKIMNRILKSDYFLMIISVLIAIIIWIYVVYEKNPMHEVWIRDLPINYINQNDDFKNGKLIILNESDNTVDVKIRGRRTAISSAKLSKITCTANMSDVTREGEYSLPVSINFSTDGIEILQKTPYNLNLNVDEVVTQTMDISVETSGTLKEGYVLGETVMTPGDIKITGPKSMLKKIKKVSVTVDLTDKEEDIAGLYKIKLYNSSGDEYTDERISRNIDYADVKIPVLSTKTVKIKALLTEGKNSAGDKVTISGVSPETVLIKGTSQDLKGVSEIETFKIDSKDLYESGKTNTYLDPSSLPDGVTTADDGAMESNVEVTYTVTVKDRTQEDTDNQ